MKTLKQESPKIWNNNQATLLSLCSNPIFYEKIHPFLIFPENNELEIGFNSFFLGIARNEIDFKNRYNVYKSKPINPKGDIIFFEKFYLTNERFF